MRTLQLFVVAALVVGAAACARDESLDVDTPQVTAGLWSDRVTVEPNQLTVPASFAESNEAFFQVLEKITSYEQQTDLLAAAGQAHPNSHERDLVDVARKLDAKGVEPVFLVGNRASDAVNPDGTLEDSSGNPNGFLRRAMRWYHLTDSDRSPIVIETIPATMAEASADLQKNGLLEVSPVANDEASWRWGRSLPLDLVNIDESKTLYEETLAAGLGKASVTLESKLKIGGTLDLAVAAKKIVPTDGRAVFTTALEGSVVLKGHFDSAFAFGDTEPRVYWSKKIAVASGTKFPISSELSVLTKCNLEAQGKIDASAGASIRAGQLKAGLIVDRNQGVSTVFEPRWPDLEPILPTASSEAAVGGRCALTVKLVTRVFDQAAGPEQSVEVYVDLQANASGNGSSSGATARGRATVTGGIVATAGGSLAPFGHPIATFDSPPFEEEWTLFDEEISSR